MSEAMEGWVSISVKTSTKARLVGLKRRMRAKNWDEVLRILIECWEECRDGQQT